MHTHSDIVGLFSKLSYTAKRYQEIASLRGLKTSSSRWTLLREMHASLPSALSATAAKPERPRQE